MVIAPERSPVGSSTRVAVVFGVDLVVVIDRGGVIRIGVGRQSGDAGPAARVEAPGGRRPLLVVEIVVVIARPARGRRDGS